MPYSPYPLIWKNGNEMEVRGKGEYERKIQGREQE